MKRDARESRGREPAAAREPLAIPQTKATTYLAADNTLCLLPACVKQYCTQNNWPVPEIVFINSSLGVPVKECTAAVIKGHRVLTGRTSGTTLLNVEVHGESDDGASLCTWFAKSMP